MGILYDASTGDGDREASKSIIDSILTELEGSRDYDGLMFMLNNRESFGPGFILNVLSTAYTSGELTVKPPKDSSSITKWRRRNGVN